MTTSFLFHKSRGSALAIILIIVSLILVGGAVAIGIQQQQKSALPLEDYENILQGIDDLSQSVPTETENTEEEEREQMLEEERAIALARVVTDLAGVPCTSETSKCDITLDNFQVNQIFSNSLGTIIPVQILAPSGTYTARLYDELNVPLSLSTPLIEQEDGSYTADLALSARPAGGSGIVLISGYLSPEMVETALPLDIGIIVPILFQYESSITPQGDMTVAPEDLPCGLTIVSPSVNQILDKTYDVQGWVNGCGWYPFEGVSGVAYLISGVENPVVISERIPLMVDETILAGEDMYEVMLSGRPLPVRATMTQNETSNINRVSLIIENQSRASGEISVRHIHPVRLTTSGYSAPTVAEFCGVVVTSPKPFATQSGVANIEGYVDGCGWRNFEGSYGTVQIFRNGEPQVAVSEKIPFTATPLTSVIPPVGKAVFTLSLPHTALTSEVGVIVFEGEAVADGEIVPRAEFPVRF